MAKAETERWFPGIGGRGVGVYWGQSVTLGRWKSPGDGYSVTAPNATELDTQKWRPGSFSSACSHMQDTDHRLCSLNG